MFCNFEWSGGWNNGVVGSWTTWFLDFNKRGGWNKRDGAKFGTFRWKIPWKLIAVTSRLFGREEYIYTYYIKERIESYQFNSKIKILYFLNVFD